jgi:hypothetical protein
MEFKGIRKEPPQGETERKCQRRLKWCSANKACLLGEASTCAQSTVTTGRGPQRPFPLMEASGVRQS